MEITSLQESLARARQRALDWRPPTDPDLAQDWRVAAYGIIALYDQAMHEASCDGCLTKFPTMIYPPLEFDLDKSRFHIRFEDETETSVRVIIEPHASRD